MRNGLVSFSLGIALSLSTGGIVGAQEDRPTDTIELAPGVTAEGLAFGPGRSEPALYRLVVGPATTHQLIADPSLVLATVERGTIAATFDRPVSVSTTTDGSTPAESVDAGQAIQVDAGGYLVVPALAAGELRNEGSTPASILVASIAVGAGGRLPTELGSPERSPGTSPGIVGAVDSKAGAFCLLEYQRADSMWAAYGKPDGALGTETITLLPGASQAFLTDWKYEKRRNDGSTYYGSHLRRTLNRSNRTIRVRVKEAGITHWETLEPGTWDEWRADLMTVSCP